MTAWVWLCERVYLNWNHPPSPPHPPKGAARSRQLWRGSRSFWDTISLKGTRLQILMTVHRKGWGDGEAQKSLECFSGWKKSVCGWGGMEKVADDLRGKGGDVINSGTGPLQCPWVSVLGGPIISTQQWHRTHYQETLRYTYGLNDEFK